MWSLPFEQFTVLYRFHLHTYTGVLLLILFTSKEITMVLLHFMLLHFFPKHKEMDYLLLIVELSGCTGCFMNLAWDVGGGKRSFGSVCKMTDKSPIQTQTSILDHNTIFMFQSCFKVFIPFFPSHTIHLCWGHCLSHYL